MHTSNACTHPSGNTHTPTHTGCVGFPRQVDKLHLNSANSFWGLLLFRFLTPFFLSSLLLLHPELTPHFVLPHMLIRRVNHGSGNKSLAGVKLTTLGFISCNHSYINMMDAGVHAHTHTHNMMNEILFKCFSGRTLRHMPHPHICRLISNTDDYDTFRGT